MDPVTFRERWRVKVTRIQLISVGALGLFIAFILFYLLFSFTPLGGLLPENVKNRNKEKIQQAFTQMEKLEKQVIQQDRYITNLQQIILGKIPIDSSFSETAIENYTGIKAVDTSTSLAEIKLSEQLEAEALTPKAKKSVLLNDVLLYDPVKGVLSQKFSPKTHPGVDIIASKGSTVNTCLGGVVMHSSYSDQDGYTVIVSHENDITSVYKHLDKVIAKVGEKVKTGDGIGILGNTGENSTGPHLHFELWSNVGPLDPLEYLSFGK